MARKLSKGGINPVFRKTLYSFSILSSIVGILLSLLLVFISTTIPGNIRHIADAQIDYVAIEMDNIHSTVISTRDSLNASSNITKHTASALSGLADNLNDISAGLNAINSGLSNLGLGHVVDTTAISDTSKELLASSNDLRSTQNRVSDIITDLDKLADNIHKHTDSIKRMRSEVDSTLDSASLALLLLGILLVALFSSTLLNAVANAMGE